MLLLRMVLLRLRGGLAVVELLLLLLRLLRRLRRLLLLL